MPPLTLFGQAAPVDSTPPDPVNPAVNDPSITDPTMRRIAELEGQRTAALGILASTDPNALPQKKVAQATIAKLEPQLSAAYRDAAANERAAAKVATSGASVSSRVAMLQAAAAQSRADAMTLRADAYAEGTSNKRAQLEADANLKNADAKVAGLKADLATATQPDQIESIHTALQRALTDLDGVKQDNVTKGLNNDVLKAKAANAPQDAANVTATGTATASSAGSKATIDAADASNATLTSAANLSKAQADASKAQPDAQTAQANFDAVTPEMRTSAGQANLDQLQANARTTQQAKADELTSLLKSGAISDPAKAHAMLQDYLNSALRGTTPYQQQSDALTAETSRSNSANTLAGSQGTAYSSMVDSAGKVFNAMNANIPQGSNAGGKALLGMMDLGESALRRFAPTGQQANSPLLQSMATGGQTTAAAPTPTATPVAAAPTGPTTTISPTGEVTIRHTPATPTIAPVSMPLTPTTSLLGPGQVGTGTDPNVAGGLQNPAFLNGMTLAMPSHIDQLWANDPNLNAGGNQAPSLRGAY